VKAHEHRAIGDLATAGAVVDLGPSPDNPFILSHGDVIALSGDYFLPQDAVHGEASLFGLAAVDGERGTRVGSRDEIVCALRVMATDEAADDDDRFGAGGAPNDVERRVRDRFITLAAANADHFVAPLGDGPTRGDAHRPANRFGSIAEAYRHVHIAALTEAYQLGRSGGDVRRAMAREAAAQHYLTDAFASGHLRTPVAAIRRYWLARYPSFWANLQRKVAADTVDALRKRSRALRTLPRQFVFDRTLAAVRLRTQAFPAMSLGDLLARVYHDWDNDHGLVLEDGTLLYGDGHVADGAGQGLAVAAVRAGNDDVEVAYGLGASGRWLTAPALFEAVRKATGALDGTFAALGLVPRHSRENAALNWRAATIEDLWHSPIVGASGTTVGESVARVLELGGEVSRRLDCLGPGVVDPFDTISVPFLRRWLGRRACEAYHEGFLDRLARAPQESILAVVGEDGPGWHEDVRRMAPVMTGTLAPTPHG
jgi:hypothetical protein